MTDLHSKPVMHVAYSKELRHKLLTCKETKQASIKLYLNCMQRVHAVNPVKLQMLAHHYYHQ